MAILEGVSMQEYLDYRFPSHVRAMIALTTQEEYADNSAGHRAKAVCGFSNQFPSRNLDEN